MKFSVASILALAGVAMANTDAYYGIPQARVVNKCDFPVTLWAVGGSVSGPYTLNPHGGTYSEGFYKDPVSGGRALKVTRHPNGLYDGSPQTIYAYNLDGQTVWYDLSDVFGNAFQGHRLTVRSDDPTCPTINWPNGIPPGGSQVKHCTRNKSVTFTLCA